MLYGCITNVHTLLHACLVQMAEKQEINVFKVMLSLDMMPISTLLKFRPLLFAPHKPESSSKILHSFLT